MSDIHDDRAALFANLESAEAQPKFWDQVADDVDWTVEGTHALCGRYRSKQTSLPLPSADFRVSWSEGQNSRSGTSTWTVTRRSPSCGPSRKPTKAQRSQ